MQITRQADYAVRAVLYLSGLDNGRRAPTSEIALNQHIPPSFLAKIVSQLSARGGVSLARAADEISLLEVVEAIDGPIMLNECVFDSNACVFGDNCPVQDVWCNAQETLVTTLRGTTFASLTPQ